MLGNTYLLLEVLGGKGIWGKCEENCKGFVAAMQALAFGPRTYYGEVSAQEARLYLLEKVNAKGCLQVMYSLYYFTFERDNNNIYLNLL